MYLLTVQEHFAAAHHLSGYQGKCAKLHGHTWRVEATVAGTRLDERGMLVDFAELKGILRRLIAEYDHQYLNELPPFAGDPGQPVNPTAENIAGCLMNNLEKELARVADGVKLIEVRVWESENACAAIRRET